MVEIITQGDNIKLAKDLREATRPVTEWDVVCLVKNLATVRVMAATPDEAAEAAASQRGVIWPLRVGRPGTQQVPTAPSNDEPGTPPPPATPAAQPATLAS